LSLGFLSGIEKALASVESSAASSSSSTSPSPLTPFGKVVGVVLIEDVFPNLPVGAGHDYLNVEFDVEAGLKKRLLVPIVRAHVAKIEKRGSGGEGGGVWITPPKGMLELATVWKEKVTIRALFGPSKRMMASGVSNSTQTTSSCGSGSS
jgi:hypothetical protein